MVANAINIRKLELDEFISGIKKLQKRYTSMSHKCGDYKESSYLP